MPGDAWNKAAGIRSLLAFMWAHPGKQLLFQGSEFGQEREWSESRSLDWHLLEDPLHSGITTMVGDMNRAYRAHSALWTKDTTPEGFSWIDANDATGNVLSFLRNGVDADGNPTVLACIANFSGTPKPDYRVGLPFAGRWREVLNTDAEIYGGSGVGNLGAGEAEQTVWQGRPASAVLQLPPSGVLWLAPEPFEGAVKRSAVAADATPTPVEAAPVDTARVDAAPVEAAPVEAASAESAPDSVLDDAPTAPVSEPADTVDPDEEQGEAAVWIEPSGPVPEATDYSPADTEAVPATSESGAAPAAGRSSGSGSNGSAGNGADDSRAAQ